MADKPPEQTTPFKWPTLADKVKSWDGICDKCGQEYPPDTRINAVWSPTQLFISCRCSPREWVLMEACK
jgi:hypothetical protein